MTIFTRSTFLASVILFSGSAFAQAQQAYTPQGQAMPQQIAPQATMQQQRYAQQFMPRYGAPVNNVWNNVPHNQNYFNRSPWSNSMPMPWNNNGSNGNGFNMPWNNGSNGNGFNMPWNNSSNGNGFNMPWNNNNNGGSNSFFPRSFNKGSNGFPTGNFNAPWNNGNNGFPNIKGPWNNGWGSAPWSSERWKNDPMGSPSKWINFNDPKEGIAEMWEDAIKGPHRLGKMPGGWKAPSISVPNPVDVTDTFGRRWRGLPTEISEQADNFTYNIKK